MGPTTHSPNCRMRSPHRSPPRRQCSSHPHRPNRHISGILWQQDLVITSDQALPAQDQLHAGAARRVLTAARPARRNAASNLASLRLNRPGRLRMAAASRASARWCWHWRRRRCRAGRALAIIQAIRPTAWAEQMRRSMAADRRRKASPVFDAVRRMLVRGERRSRAVGERDPLRNDPAGVRSAERRAAAGEAGWGRASRSPCRNRCATWLARAPGAWWSVGAGGPAELAGLRRGDVLLSLDGHSVSGAHALRTLLGSERIGRQVEIRVMRDGKMATHHLTVAPQPVD